MVYELINSKIIISRLFDHRSLDYSGFISRVPNWIHEGMRLLNIHTSLINDNVDGQIVDYKCAIPSECKKLLGVSYLGYRLKRIDRINEGSTDEMGNLYHEQLKYQLDHNGYIILTIEDCDLGDLVFHIKKLPMELDSTTNLYFPMIPNVEKVLDALEHFILFRILSRGHKIPGLSLKEDNEFTNPGLAWKLSKKGARNAAEEFDYDDRNTVSEMIRTFLVDYEYYYEDQINNKRKE